jgi:hypothetical protein
METSWHDICDSLQRHYRLGERGGDWIGLMVDVGSRAAPVVVKLGSRAGQRCLVLAAGVGHTAAIPSDAALRYNAAAEHGTLAVEDGIISLRCLARLDEPDLPKAIAGMADEASRMAGWIGGLRSAHEPFTGYVD